MYLCDQCDIAGFLEVNIKTIAFELGTDRKSIEKAFVELCPDDKQEIKKASRDESPAPRILYSNDGKFIFIRNFIKNQNNLPLNENNMAHKGIIKRLNDKSDLFGFQTVEDFFKAPSKPLQRGYSIGNSNSIGNERDRDIGGMGEKEKEKTEKTWRDSFDIYLEEETTVYNNLIQNQDFIKDRQRYHPNLNIVLSLEKAHRDFWGTVAGWKNKKASRTNKIDWVSTFKKALDQRFNHVYINNNSASLNKQTAMGTAVAIAEELSVKYGQ